jgi:methyl coenzyme M reductase subunit D
MRQARLPRTAYGPGESWFTRHRDRQAARVEPAIIPLAVKQSGRALARTKRWLRNNPLMKLSEAPRHIRDHAL